MNEMVDRGAKAALEAEEDWLRREGDAEDGLAEHNTEPLYHAIARAVIQAMREPTEAMINNELARCYNHGEFADKEVRRIYSAMIDEALK